MREGVIWLNWTRIRLALINIEKLTLKESPPLFIATRSPHIYFSNQESPHLNLATMLD